MRDLVARFPARVWHSQPWNEAYTILDASHINAALEDSGAVLAVHILKRYGMLFRDLASILR